MDTGISYSIIENFSYLFIPFSYYDSGISYSSLVKYLDFNLGEALAKHKMESTYSYLFKYIIDKIDVSSNDSNSKNKCCTYYDLNMVKFTKKYPLTSLDSYVMKYRVSPQGQDHIIKFKIDNISLHLFNTGIGIISVKIKFLPNERNVINTEEIENGLFYLKRVNKVFKLKDGGQQPKYKDFEVESPNGNQSGVLYMNTETMEEEEDSLLQMIIDYLDTSITSKRKTLLFSNFDYFFHSNKQSVKSNCLSFIDLSKDGFNNPDYLKKHLYYLANTYGSFYTYYDEVHQGKYVSIRNDKNVLWGITQEHASVIVCSQNDTSNFINGQFINHFQTDYYLVYLFLLHQKYALYAFLKRIVSSSNIKEMEKTKSELFQFETDFVFTTISETYNYNKLNKEIKKIMEIDELYKEAKDPLISLGNQKQYLRDKNFNRFTCFLSICGIFSLSNSLRTFISDISEKYNRPDNSIEIMLFICSMFILYIIVLAIKNFKDQ